MHVHELPAEDLLAEVTCGEVHFALAASLFVDDALDILQFLLLDLRGVKSEVGTLECCPNKSAR